MRNLGLLTPFLILSLIVLGGCGSSPKDNSTNSTVTKKEATETDSTRPDTLPLISIMVNLEQEMHTISSGLWRHDFKQIAQAAARIANHAKIPKSQIKSIRQILGKREFKAFVKDDKTVHNMAVKLNKAAKQEDFKLVAERFQKLQQGCVSCHRMHRNEIRSSNRW